MPLRDNSRQPNRREALMSAVRALVTAGDAQDEGLADFVAAYFAHVPIADLERAGPGALLGTARSHWRLAASRKSGEPIVRVFDAPPEGDPEAWPPARTIVEVVNDDMPFLVDSLSAELARREITVHLVIHPVVFVVHDDAGHRVSLASEGAGHAESLIRYHLGRVPGAEYSDLAAALARVLGDVRAATSDLQPIRRRLRAIISSLPDRLPGQSGAELDEVSNFLAWLYETNFTFLGYRAYRIEGSGARQVTRIEPHSGLGVLSLPDTTVFDDLTDGAPLPPAARAFLAQPSPLAVTKASRRATVHRPALMDTIVIKRYADEGPEWLTTGAHLIVGLFGSAAYIRSARSIPLLRRKIDLVAAKAGFAPKSHDQRALINILETFPRDELFQVSEAQLLDVALGILDLQQRPRVKLFVRHDDFQRFISCLVYMPRDRFTTRVRLAIQAILGRAYQGDLVAHYTQMSDAPYARLQIVLRTRPGAVPAPDPAVVETDIVAVTRSWADRLADALTAAHGEEEGTRLAKRYARAFPPAYRERFAAAEVVLDIARVERALVEGGLGMALYRPHAADDDEVRFKLFQRSSPIPLSQVMPLLEAFGVKVIDEVPHAVIVDESGDDAGQVMIHDFGLETESGRRIDLTAVREHFFAAFLAVWNGDQESDRLNALVLDAGLDWREVVVLRTYIRYVRQAGIPFSQRYLETAAVANPEIAKRIVGLFRARLGPGIAGRDARADAIRAEIATLLDQVANADDDRILRRFLNLVEATLRTNFFRRAAAGTKQTALAMKFDSQRIDDLPLPRPMVEVFVYAPQMEGIHLRGGKVARGGIRWSDRREDFRTEILSLMKAQTVKNTVIVPVGAKGGFVLKQPPDPADREATQAAGIAAYRLLIAAFLDVTDNLTRDGVTPPPQVERRDDDDPYLVVAADKGTATFSDIANAIAIDCGFWLGDAFASGGSRGYDHKKMGITARGAWESVRRHFRELGRDVQTDPLTVIGVGDMSGDVFGNGMLLLPAIRLLAAFDHRHIFVDPEPDPALALAERQRLFALSRSAWTDYDAACLSAGGKIFQRSAKVLSLSREIRDRFAIVPEQVTPAALSRLLLQADVDLLWFGGIGTFVKATRERHADAGDRGNDAIRVDAAKLRCKVIGEGANLGVTQLGRIEYAALGGRINTDFIDNSAGVDCSDHEVNIKILLDSAVAEGGLAAAERDALLTDMTEEVAALVLADNYAQTQAISLLSIDSPDTLDDQGRLMRVLERLGRLNREVEFLPNDEALTERAQARRGLTRPEIAVLFSYCKIWLSDEILRSNLPDDEALADQLARYFPTPLRRRFPGAIASHRLRRELIATISTNSLVNRMGGTFITDTAEKTGAAPVDIARAYMIAQDVFAVPELWRAIEALDGDVAWPTQARVYARIHRLIARTTSWFLRHGGHPLDIAANIARYKTAIGHLGETIEAVLPSAARAAIDAAAAVDAADGVPADLAYRIAILEVMPPGPDLVRLAAAHGAAVEMVAALYFAVGESFGLSWLRAGAERLAVPGYWQRLAVAAVIDELYEHQRRLVEHILALGAEGPPEQAIAAWTEAHTASSERARGLFAELKAAAAVDLPMLTVASRQLRSLTED